MSEMPCSSVLHNFIAGLYNKSSSLAQWTATNVWQLAAQPATHCRQVFQYVLPTGYFDTFTHYGGTQMHRVCPRFEIQGLFSRTSTPPWL
jgi:hypothetical protein